MRSAWLQQHLGVVVPRELGPTTFILSALCTFYFLLIIAVGRHTVFHVLLGLPPDNLIRLS